MEDTFKENVKKKGRRDGKMQGENQKVNEKIYVYVRLDTPLSGFLCDCAALVAEEDVDDEETAPFEGVVEVV